MREWALRSVDLGLYLCVSDVSDFPHQPANGETLLMTETLEIQRDNLIPVLDFLETPCLCESVCI